MAEEFGAGDVGGEVDFEVVAGGVFGEVGGPAIEIGLAVPSPAVLDGERAADAGNDGVDIAVGVGVVDNLGFGGLNGGVGGAEVLVLEVEGAGAEDDGLDAVLFGDIDDDVRDDELLEGDETGLDGGVILGGVGREHGVTEFDHFEVVKAKQRGGDKQKRYQNQQQLPEADAFEAGEGLFEMIRTFATHCWFYYSIIMIQ